MTAAYDSIIAEAARRHGVPPETIRRFIEIESAGRPDTRTGSYKGLLQLSDGEFRKHGGTGSIYDPSSNIDAGTAKIAAESRTFREKYGRDPTAGELYMIHQQGWGGYQEHVANPDRPAWQSMAATGEGRSKGDGWARLAISGNMPASWKREIDPESITSGEFVRRWTERVNRAPGQAPRSDVQVAQISAPSREVVASAAPQPDLPIPSEAQPEAGAPDMQALVAAMRAIGGSLDRRQVPFTPLPTSFRQYDSLMRA